MMEKKKVAKEKVYIPDTVDLKILIEELCKTDVESELDCISDPSMKMEWLNF